MDIELIEPPSTELTVQDRACLALGSDKTRIELYELATKSAHLVEVKNKAARDEIHSAAMVLANARIAISKTGKAARDDATKFSKAVIAEEASLIAITEPEEKRLLALRDAWDAVVAAEKAERERIERDKAAALQGAIDWIKEHAFAAHGKSSAAIADMVTELAAVEITLEQYGERTGEAELARMTTLERMGTLHAAALAMEARAEALRVEREEFEARRNQEAEQQRVAAEAAAAAKLKDEREAFERQRTEQEERAKAEAITRSALEAEQAELAKQRAEFNEQQAIAAAAAKAEAERVAAEARAAQAKADEERREAERIEKERIKREELAEKLRIQREKAREATLLENAQIMRNAIQRVAADAGFPGLTTDSQEWVALAMKKLELAGEPS